MALGSPNLCLNLFSILSDYFGEALGPALAGLYPFVDFNPSGTATSQIFTDTVLCGSRFDADAWSEHGNTYFYYFTQTVNAPIMNFVALQYDENAAPLGTFHGSEVPYIFGFDSTLGIVKTANQLAVRSAMMSYWTNFARIGSPEAVGLAPWPNYSQSNPQFLGLNSDFTVGVNLRGAYCDFYRGRPDF